MRDVSGNVSALHNARRGEDTASGMLRIVLGVVEGATGGPSSVDPGAAGDSQVGTR